MIHRGLNTVRGDALFHRVCPIIPRFPFQMQGLWKGLLVYFPFPPQVQTCHWTDIPGAAQVERKAEFGLRYCIVAMLINFQEGHCFTYEYFFYQMASQDIRINFRLSFHILSAVCMYSVRAARCTQTDKFSVTPG